MNEQEIVRMAYLMFAEYDLVGWAFDIVDDLPQFDVGVGYTNIETKRVILSRETWPVTNNENMKELVRHEVAHAICGHGRHDLEWWETLRGIGGSGTWFEDNGAPASWSWTREKVMEAN
jgi:hypothetical protein